MGDNFPAMAKTLLLVALGVTTVAYVIFWIVTIRRQRAKDAAQPAGSEPTTCAAKPPTPFFLAVGFVTDFLDTLAIGSFATTTSIFKFTKAVPDRVIPGTLNAGHLLPTVVQAFIYVKLVAVDVQTLVLLIVAAVAGGWLGAGFVANWPKRKIQIGMGVALVAAAILMTMKQQDYFPKGSDALGLSGAWLVVGVLGNFVLGVLMNVGIGLYAPCMIMISLLGMNPETAFPIMMGSCAFLMPASSMRFIRKESYHAQAALGLALGGIPAVFLAASVEKMLSVNALRWLVIVVVIYTAVVMLWSASQKEPIPEKAAN